MSNILLSRYILSLVFFHAVLSVSSIKAQETLSLGIHPYLPATELVLRFTPLADYIAQHTGSTVQITVATDYQQHIEQIGKDKLDIVYLGPAAYVKMTEAYGEKPILGRLEVQGKPFFQGAIVTRKNSSLQHLSGLKGKRFAFGDRFSTMSHLVPRYVLWRAGVNIKDLAEYDYLNSHHNVALGVLMGDFDAGAVKEEVATYYRNRGLRVLAVTPFISEHLLVTRATLPTTTSHSIRQAIYRLKDHPQRQKIISAIKATATAIVPATDANYDNLRDILKTLNEQGVQF